MTRILFDAFYHMLPGHRIGNQIAVGGYQTNYGRYSPGDCFHPNGISFLHADLAGDYDLRLLTAPYSETSLFDADILLVTNPDYPHYEGTTPYRWTPKDVDALLAFVERGGGVLLMVNSFLSYPDFWEENFDYERVSLLFDRLGLRWDPNFMSDDQTIERAKAGDYTIGYGQGGRVFGAKLPENVKPVMTRDGQVYGFEKRIGSGKLVVLGDAGMISNGLVCFPGFDNATYIRELFQGLKPQWCNSAPQQWDLLHSGHISSAPSKTGLSEEIIRGLRPGAQWMEDHHYRHLTWEAPLQKGQGDEVWQQLPVSIADLHGRQATARLTWAKLDSDEPGAAIEVPLTINSTRHGMGTDLHVLGRAQARDLNWSDLSANPTPLQCAGKIEVSHVVFELKLVLDSAGKPRSARWSQGQITYARSETAVHYGYEIVLNSTSGVIAPRSA